jgi:tripartite-type tricarboxylate transporter receptor subunit TctC
VGTFPLVLLTNSNNPAKSVSDLVSFAKQNPDKVNYSAPSASFQLIAELFNGKTGTRFQHIPYKGSADAITAVMTQDVTMTLIDTGPALTALQGNRVKALAVSSGERLKELPNVPTMTELGIDINVSFWSGLLAPAGTPSAVVKKIQEEVARVLDLPDVKKRISSLAITPVSTTPEQFDKMITQEINAWRLVATEKNIKAN